MSTQIWIPRLLWVAGGRDYSDEATMGEVLIPYAKEWWTLITGAQRGADEMAEGLWRKWELPYIGIPAQWSRRGRTAGPERNRRIAQIWQPTRLIWFPGGAGTASAIKAAEEFGVKVEAWDKS